MTIRLAAPLALLTLAFAVPAFAIDDEADAASAPSTEQAAAEAKPDKQRRVCRSETATGSVMPRRVCRTVEQIEADRRNAEQFRDQQNRMGTSSH